MKNILESKPSILRFDHRRTIVKVNRSEIVFADIKFDSNQKFQIENFTEITNYDLRLQNIQSLVDMISNSPQNTFRDAINKAIENMNERAQT